jgi:hypothetical protein
VIGTRFAKLTRKARGVTEAQVQTPGADFVCNYPGEYGGLAVVCQDGRTAEGRHRLDLEMQVVQDSLDVPGARRHTGIAV